MSLAHKSILIPQSFASATGISLSHTQPLPYPPHPMTARPFGFDPLFPLFDSSFSVLEENSGPVEVVAKPPVNVYSLASNTPVIVSISSVIDPVNGGIPEKTVLLVSISSLDAAGLETRPSPIQTYTVPSNGSVKNQLVVTATRGHNTDTLKIYTAVDNANYGLFENTSDTTGDTVISNRPDLKTGPGIPDSLFHHYVLQGRPEPLGAIWMAPVAAVTPQTLLFNGATFSVNQLAGRTISQMSRVNPVPADHRVKYLNLPILSNTADTLTFDAAQIDFTGGGVLPSTEVGDMWAVRTQPDTFSISTIGDSLLVNHIGSFSFAGMDGLGMPDYSGKLVFCISGALKGVGRLIANNTLTVITTATPFPSVPDASCVFVVTDSIWAAQVNSVQISNSKSPGDQVVMEFALDTSQDQLWFIELYAADADSNNSKEEFSPFREIFIPAAPPPDSSSLITATRA